MDRPLLAVMSLLDKPANILTHTHVHTHTRTHTHTHTLTHTHTHMHTHTHAHALSPPQSTMLNDVFNPFIMEVRIDTPTRTVVPGTGNESPQPLNDSPVVSQFGSTQVQVRTQL